MIQTLLDAKWGSEQTWVTPGIQERFETFNERVRFMSLTINTLYCLKNLFQRRMMLLLI